jgi:hypothetical protein
VFSITLIFISATSKNELHVDQNAYGSKNGTCGKDGHKDACDDTRFKIVLHFYVLSATPYLGVLVKTKVLT